MDRNECRERARRRNIEYQGPRLSLMFDASSEPSRPTSRSTIPHQHVHHTPPPQTRDKRRPWNSKDSSTEKSPNCEIRRPTFTSRSRQLIHPMLQSTKFRGPRGILTIPSIFLVDRSSRKNWGGRMNELRRQFEVEAHAATSFFDDPANFEKECLDQGAYNHRN